MGANHASTTTFTFHLPGIEQPWTLAGDPADHPVVPVGARRRNRLSYTYVRTWAKADNPRKNLQDECSAWVEEVGKGVDSGSDQH